MKPFVYVWLAVALGSIAFLTACNQSSGGDDAEADAGPIEPVPVRAVKATVTTLRPAIDLIGTVMQIPERTSVIAAQQEGRIASVSVVEGQSVKAGDVLIKLDCRQAEARLAGAQAAKQRAEAMLTKLKRGPRPEEVEAARQESLQQAADAHALEVKLDALRPLHASGDLSDVEFGQAEARLAAAQAASRAAESRLRLLEAGTRPEEIAEAQAELAAAEAEVESQALAVEFCTIRSSIAGVVEELAARAGASVAPSDMLASVVDTSALFVQVRIPGTYFAQVKTGAAADVRVARSAGAAIHGTVARIGPRANPDTGDVDVFVLVDNKTGELVPELACRVRVWLPPLDNVLAIPAAAVADRDGTPVITQIRDNKAYEHPIELGTSADDQIQVVSGLKAGDWVAVDGGYGLPEGCPVRLVTTAAESGSTSDTGD